MEETYSFFMLEVLKVSKTQKSPFLYRFLPKKLRQKKEEEFIRNKLPVEKEEITAYGQLGLKVTLPYSYGDFESMTIEESSNIFLRIIEREDAKNIVVNQRLLKYLKQEHQQQTGLLSILYMEDILRWITKEHDIPKKDVRLVILDQNGSGHTPFVLEQLGEELNFLTIVTSRKEYFYDYADYMYSQTGLTVSLIEDPKEGVLDGNFVIDLRSDPVPNYDLYPQDAIVYQCYYKYKDIRNLIAKRKDITCYNKMAFMQGMNPVDQQLLSACIGDGNVEPNPVQCKLMRDRMKVWNIQVSRLGIKI